MRKILIISSLTIVFVASFFIGYKLTASNKSATQLVQTTPSSIPVTALMTDNPSTPPPIPAATVSPTITPTVVPKAPSSIYCILGSSTTPKKYPDTAMTKWRNDMVTLTKKYPSGLYINGAQTNKVVALTFDDGPDPVNTLKIVNILKANNVHATFFCVGNQLEGSKSIIKQAYANGNVIASHSWSHKDFTTLNTAGIKTEIEKTATEINKLIGKKPLLVRPPYGATNTPVQSVLASLNYKSILWSIDTLDWEQKQPANILKNVIDNVRPGEIILMHCDGDKATTAQALPSIIEDLKAMGYGFVTIDKLLDVPAYN